MESPEATPAFPYSLIWEEREDQWVTIDSLRINEESYEMLFRAFAVLGADTPFVSKAILSEMAEHLSIEPAAKSDLVDSAFLIAGWYLAPAHRHFMDADPKSASARLKKVAQKARELDELIGAIHPKLAAAMNYVLSVEPDVFASQSPTDMLMALGRELHDLALVADRVIAGISAAGTGRKKSTIRDTALRLLLEAVEQAGCGPVLLSAGTARHPDPHFGGEGGAFVRSFLALVEPGMGEASFVAPAKRSRRVKRAPPARTG